MVNRSFYNLVNDNHPKKHLEKLCFKMDFTGPQYKITFGEKYEGPIESIENNDYKLEVTTPRVKEITDEKAKKNILLRLIHHNSSL